MQYREFGKTGEKVSALGFGMMRLPNPDGTQGGFSRPEIDEAAAIANLRAGIDAGINYVDTAYNYSAEKSEIVTGKALKDGYREKVLLATKLPVWKVEAEEDFDKLLSEQLQKLDVDYIDMYLLHSLSGEKWRDTCLKFDLPGKMKKAKEEGKIRYMGFSFHDDVESFKEIVDGADWDFCQIQLNYLDTENQAGIEGLKYAAEKGLAVVIMEPLRGGYLARVPEAVSDVFAKVGKTAVQGALDFLWDMPEVSLILSGMSSMEQVTENVEYAAKSGIGLMTEEQHEAVKAAAEMMSSAALVPCTACNYCNICPQNVAIPTIFAAYNKYVRGESGAKSDYHKITPEVGAKADSCIGCKVCESICPQHIAISDWMPKIDLLCR